MSGIRATPRRTELSPQAGRVEASGLGSALPGTGDEPRIGGIRDEASPQNANLQVAGGAGQRRSARPGGA
jgi:hypothetical protein